jgi:hypothetical protein
VWSTSTGTGHSFTAMPRIGEDARVLVIEVRHCLGSQRALADRALARLHAETVVEEIELDLKGTGAVLRRLYPRAGIHEGGDKEAEVEAVVVCWLPRAIG